MQMYLLLLNNSRFYACSTNVQLHINVLNLWVNLNVPTPTDMNTLTNVCVFASSHIWSKNEHTVKKMKKIRLLVQFSRE